MAKEGFKYEDGGDQFFTGVGIEHRKHDLNWGQIARTAKCLGMADFLFVIGEAKYPSGLHSDTSKAHLSIPSFKFDNFKDLMDRRPSNCEIVAVELCDRAIDITKFQWPKRAVIVLGGEEVGCSKETIKSARYVIKLPNQGVSMNVASAASCVLFHRYLQLKQMGMSV